MIPRVIFTDPQVAVVGMTDEEANAAGIVCECNTIPMSVAPRAGAIRDTRGVIKINSSVLVTSSALLENRAPNAGMLPSSGTCVLLLSA